MTQRVPTSLFEDNVDLSGKAVNLPDGSVVTADLADAAVTAAKAAAGVPIQSVGTTSGAVATGSTIIPRDDTIPQISEGTQFLSCAITPLFAASILQVDAVLFASASVTSDIVAALFRDSGANALAVGSSYGSTALGIVCVSFRHRVVAGSVSPTTFTVRAGPISAGTLTVNGSGGGRYYGNVFASSITITEIKA
jgi:hypothetical protein